MNFRDAMREMSTVKSTENGAYAYNTAGSALMDFFAVVGSMRERSENEIISMFHAARRENEDLADRIVLYARDIRTAGLGERRIGRILMRELAKLNPEKVKRNFETFVNYGRFDDLYSFVGTAVEYDMWKYMRKVLMKDVEAMANNKPITLAAKWMKSINTSSKESRELAKKFCKINNLSEKTYRKTLAALRKYTNVVETKMSARQWGAIDFEKVPSLAMKRYTNAFNKHCPSFQSFKQALETGEAKINAATLFPYDITYDFMYAHATDKKILEAQWKTLPEYFKEGRRVVCMADVSGSMWGRPMAASVGLALYCAEHNTGAYHGCYLTFTDTPRFFELDENSSIENNINKVMRNAGYNTNLDGAFEAIYDLAKNNNDAPEALLIVSDMEINRFTRPGACDSIVDKWVKKFASIGLECPKLIFWNVQARQNTYLSKMTNPRVAFVSGCSAGTFANLSELIDYTAYEAMVKILTQFEYV